MGTTKEIKNILLIDDDEDNNFIHKMVIRESGLNAHIVSVLSVQDAMAILNSGEKPDLIFLDINMPVLTGWDFLNEYRSLPKEKRENCVIIMLTTSLHEADQTKARSYREISEYKTKHLTISVFKQLVNKHFEEDLK
jgi:CheY-like chemotaxis protein